MRDPESTEITPRVNALLRSSAGDSTAKRSIKMRTLARDLETENQELRKLLRRAFDAMEHEECFGDLFLNPIRKALFP